MTTTESKILAAILPILESASRDAYEANNRPLEQAMMAVIRLSQGEIERAASCAAFAVTPQMAVDLSREAHAAFQDKIASKKASLLAES